MTRKIQAIDTPIDTTGWIPEEDAVVDLTGVRFATEGEKGRDEKRDDESDRAYRDFVARLEAEGALKPSAGEKPAGLSGKDDEEAAYRAFVEQSGMNDFVGADVEGPREAADMSGSAGGDRAPEGAVGGFFGVDQLLEIAAQDGADLSEGGEDPDEDLDLHDELRRRNHEEHFGPDEADGTDDEAMWAEYRKAVGEDR